MADIRTHYIDTSAATKLFVDEDGNSDVRDYFSKHSVFFITSLCFAETLGVLKLKALRNLISQEQYLAACEELTTLLRGETLQIDDVNIADRQTFDEVEHLAKRYTLDVADALQLVTLQRGCCSTLDDDSKPILITADKKLADAARTEGLRVWNCLKEPTP